MPDPVAATAGTQSPLVDEQHPWLGLLPFRQEHGRFFFGRDVEIEEILLRIRENALTILFGQSGLGKSSLLAAAVIPRLAGSNFAPLYLRLDYSAGAPSLLEQTRDALRRATPGIAWPPDAPRITLWELFHRLPALLPSGSPAPALVFDQFEEIFTLGRQGSARAHEAEEWLEQMADLLQNRPPHSLQVRFAENRRLSRDYDFGTSSLRVVFALREDYLSHLEGWKTRLPALTQNRMALLPLDGVQAIEAVLGPASLGERPLLGREVAARIVRTIARVEPETPLAQIRAVPPLLSLLCEQLNAARLAAGAPEISAGMVSGQSDDILQRFYTESFTAFPAEHRETIRAVIEDPPMITEGGYRNALVRDDAEAGLARLGVANPRAVFDALVQRRLIIAEEKDHVQRLEVTHDVLVPLIVRSRKERRDRVDRELAERQASARRRKAIAWIAASLTVAGFSLGLTFWALREKAVARERQQDAENEKARALGLIRFMDAQVGEAFVDAVPLPLRERVSARVDAFYAEHDALETFDEHQRMGYHMRKAQVHLAAMRAYQNDASMADEWKERYVNLERESAAGALTAALQLGDKLAGKPPLDQGVTRDRILTHYYLSQLSSQLKDTKTATEHLGQAQKYLDALAQGSPFSAVHYTDWMGLPNLDAAMGDLKVPNGDQNGGKVSYERALSLQTQLVARRPWDEGRIAELRRLEQILGKSLPAGALVRAAEPKNQSPREPHTNGLGMPFVPIPGTKVQFSNYETRVKDYRVFIRETGYIHMRETADPDSRMWSVDRDGNNQRGYSWENPGFGQTEDCPVVGVSWRDARAFCEWLTLREHASGRLPADLEYRLPTDAEWSAAAGLVEEDPLKSPEEKHKHPVKDRYPWGKSSAGNPLPAKVGNYAGTEAADQHWPAMFRTIQGYNDGYARTAPVGSFKPNEYGINDLGGNVWEWCETGIGPNACFRVLRGGSWGCGMDLDDLLSSHRQAGKPGARYADYGFRCVVGLPVSKADATQTAATK